MKILYHGYRVLEQVGDVALCLSPNANKCKLPFATCKVDEWDEPSEVTLHGSYADAAYEFHCRTTRKSTFAGGKFTKDWEVDH